MSTGDVYDVSECSFNIQIKLLCLISFNISMQRNELLLIPLIFVVDNS